MNNKIKLGDIVHVAMNPDIMAYVTDIRSQKDTQEAFKNLYYVEFFSGPLAEGKHVTYYYAHEIRKVT